MKKNILNRIFAAAAVCASLLMSSCYDNVYQVINAETEIESSGINGDIYSIVRFGDYIFLQNGRIYYKTNSEANGQANKLWHRVNQPTEETGSNGIPSHVQFLASDSEYLYALVYIWSENSDGETLPGKIQLFATNDKNPVDGIAWKLVDIDSMITPGGTHSHNFIKSIFDNQYVNLSNISDTSKRNAYIRIHSNGLYRVFKLDGFNTPTQAIDKNGAQATSALGSETVSCTYYYKDGEDYFSKFYGIASNSDYIYISASATSGSNNVAAASMVYMANGYNMTSGFTLNGGALKPYGVSAGVLSISAGPSSLLLGTTSGIKAYTLVNGVPLAEKVTGVNGSSVVSEYVFCTFMLDPSKDEGLTTEYISSTIYSSISSSNDTFSETGLYAYYPSRLKWDRDGTGETSDGN